LSLSTDNQPLSTTPERASPTSQRASTHTSVELPPDFDPRKLLRRRSSLVIDDISARERIREALAASKTAEQEGAPKRTDAERIKEMFAAAKGNSVAKEKDGDSKNGKEDEKKVEKKEEKKPPTQFHEPDANSLLDAFGF
jgi:hypothetical protein